MLSFGRRRFLRAMAQCASGAAVARSVSPQAATPVQSPAAFFEEVPPSASGIHWAHTAGLSSGMYLPETIGPGCAFLDYDNDGWMDIYLVNSGPCDFYTPAKPLSNALYHNNRDGTFTDVTAKAGVRGNAYGMGVAVGDYNGDGFPDLYVTQYPRSILYRNNGDGTFTDVTEKAGVAAPGWSSSVVWFDYDNDGRLDLFVCRFGSFSKDTAIFCGNRDTGAHYYCSPKVVKPSSCWLFHNNGDGTFTDVSKESGIAALESRAWGVVAADINNDGRVDLFVSNDGLENFLLANRGGGKFEDVGLVAGVAYNPAGAARSGMGVDAADYDSDGNADLFVANIDHEDYSLYQNRGKETFDDVAMAQNIASATHMLSGWGLKFFDFDNDGTLDLIMANGHPDTMVKTHTPSVDYRMPMLLMQGTGKGFKNVSKQAGPVFAKPIAGRGLALGDFNNDGAVDALVMVNDGPPILLRNTVGRRNHWLGLRLIGRKANIDAVGAVVRYQAGSLKRTLIKPGGGSFLSSHDPRMVLGLGGAARVDWLELHWPRPGGVERFENLPADRYITIVEGQGSWK
jgi:enediyne biosynthesis protein E4